MHAAGWCGSAKGCGAQTSVPRTVMHGTAPSRAAVVLGRLPDRHPPSRISAKQLQRQLGIGRHETAWMMLHKLRRAMVAPEREPLKARGRGRRVLSRGYEQGLRGGRQRGKKTLVASPSRSAGGSGRLRLQVLADASGNSLGAFVKATTASGAIVVTDGWPGYAGLRALGFEHRRRRQQASPVGEQLLPRAHRAVSNLKAWLHGTHRYASPEHLPAYLDEYVFRHNRRGNPTRPFQTLLGLSVVSRSEDGSSRAVNSSNRAYTRKP